MGHNVDFFIRTTVFFKQCRQGRIIENPEWIKYGDAGADPDDPDMGDIAERSNDLFEFACRQDQRVAAGQQDIGDFAVFADVIEHGGDITEDFLLWMDEDPLAEAVPADALTDIADQQEDGRIVFVLHAGQNGIPLLVGRVQAAPGFQLIHVRNDETADRVGRVVPVDQRQVIIVGSESKLLRNRIQIPLFIRRHVRKVSNIRVIAEFSLFHAIPVLNV